MHTMHMQALKIHLTNEKLTEFFLSAIVNFRLTKIENENDFRPVRLYRVINEKQERKFYSPAAGCINTHHSPAYTI